MIDIRMPNITATTPQGQMEQVRSYLFQMAQQLNFSLREVEKKADAVQSTVEGSAASSEVEKAQSTFNSLKGLIIKSADIVNAYYETINTKLSGEYVAESKFGAFKENTEAELTATSEYVKQKYDSVQEVLNAFGERVEEIISSAYITSGHIGFDEKGNKVYGIAVGETITDKNVETFRRFAWFTPGKLSFFDANDTEVAYISDSTLYITNAVIKGTLQVDKYVFDPTYGLALVWVGG